MPDKRDKLMEFAERFAALCKANDIWFSLDKNTLLGAIKYGDFVPWLVKFEVMVTIEGLAKLKALFPDQIVDDTLDETFDSLKSVFVDDNKQWRMDQPFVEMRVIVPTTADQYVVFRSRAALLKRKLARQPENQKQAIDDLYVERNEGYFLLDDRRSSRLEQSWIQVLSFATKDVMLGESTFPVIVEADTFLKKCFGPSYMSDKDVPAMKYVYPAPLKKVAATEVA